ncbi:MAG: putative toxin-antitoxin system toxin component, PIN family [Snowella sp.]|nr:putative toxin-antitoxin system toxin component, PIN family [Snowella sp.]
MYKVIIDTNIWVSFLIGKQFDQLKELLINQTIQPIYSQQLLDELYEVTQRPKLQKYFRKDKTDSLIEFLKEIGELIQTKSEISICRDPKDNYLLALAQDSDANFLITGDQDLLVLEKFSRTIITSYSDFLKHIGQ